MINNKKWFSIIVAMWLVLITSLLAFTILEFIIPFSKDIKWIENSTKSYYQANNWIETGLYFFSNRTDANARGDSWKTYNSNYDYSFSTFSSWSTIPPLWKWVSPIDSNMDIISLTEPIQLSVWYWFITNINQLNIDFRVPDFDKDWLFLQTLDWTTNSALNWQLSSENDTLNSIPASIFTSNNINWWNIQFSWLNGKKVSDSSTVSFSTFFTDNNCHTTSKCILKISVINDLKSSSKIIPFLEWNMTSGSNIVPLRYSIIESSGKSFWFTKSLKIKVPQETVSQAFDFTVFQ